MEACLSETPESPPKFMRIAFYELYARLQEPGEACNQSLFVVQPSGTTDGTTSQLAR